MDILRILKTKILPRLLVSAILVGLIGAYPMAIFADAAGSVAGNQDQIPAYIGKSATKVELFKLTITQGSPKDFNTLDTVNVRMLGDTGDVAAGGVLLLKDDGSEAGVIDAGDTQVANASISGGYANLGLPSNYADDIADVAAGGSVTYFVAVNISDSAVTGHTVDARVETDGITFNSGAITLPDSGLLAPSQYITIDATAPVVASRTTVDKDNDGYIDQIIITTTDTNGLNDDFSGLTVDVAGVAGEAVVTGNTANDNVFLVNFTDSTLTSGATPGVNISANTTLGDYYSNAYYNVELGNDLGTSNVAATDATRPILLSVANYDTNGDGANDEIYLTFSEPITDASVAAGDIRIDANADGIYEIANAVLDGTVSNGQTDAANDQYLTLTSASLAGTGTSKVGVQVQADSITDAATSPITSGAAQTIAYDAVSGNSDKAAPIITAAETGDQDSDGFIDNYKLTFSELIDGATLTAGAANGFTVANIGVGGTGEQLDAAADGTNIDTGVDYSTLYLTFSEDNNYTTGGTGVKPQINYADDNINGVTDTGVELAAINDGALTETDRATPVVLLTNAATKSNPNDTANRYTKNITIKYSEDISASTPNKDQFAVLNTDNAGVTISSATALTDTLTLVLSQVDTDNDTDQMSVAYSGGSIVDAVSLAAAAFGDTDVTDAVKPVVITQTYKSNGGNGTVDRLELVFSEHVTIITAGQIVVTQNGLTGFNGAASNVVGTADNILTFTIAGTTNLTGAASAPTYTYTENGTPGNRIRDNAATPNDLGAITDQAITDGATPVKVSMQMKDANTNGKVDSVEVTYSEALAATTATSPWTLANVPSSGSLASVARSSNVATLTIGEGVGTADTSVGSFTVALNNGSSDIKDLADLPAASFTAAAPTDAAGPVLLNFKIGDKAGTPGCFNEIDDTIKMVFSEPLKGANVPDKADSEAAFTFAGTDTTDGGNFPTEVGGSTIIAYGTTNQANDTIVYSFSAGDTASVNLLSDGTANLTVDKGAGYIAGSITDAADVNFADTYTGSPILHSSLDVTPPAFSSAAAIDNTHIAITFAEPITIIGTPTWGAAVTATGISVTGGSVVGAVLTVTTAALSGTAFTAANLGIGAGTVEDAAGNDNLVIAGQNITDGQAPALISAKFTDLTHLEMTFSENMGLAATVDETKITLTNNVGDAIAVTNNSASVATTKVTVTTASVLSTAFSISTGGQGLDLAAGAVQDLAGVANPNVEDLDNGVADGINPTFVSAVATSNTNVQLTFSEPVTVFDATAFKIDRDSLGEPGRGTGAAIDGTDNTKVNVEVAAGLSNTAYTSDDLDILINGVKDLSLAANGIAQILNQHISDGQAPVITTTMLVDRDHDGRVDAADIVFSEAIVDASIAAGDWTIGGYTATGYDTLSFPNDENIEIRYDTDNLAINTAANAAQVVFSNGDSIRDASTPHNHLAANSSLTELDGANPIPVSVSSTRAVLSGDLPTATVLTVAFSEPVTVTPGSIDVTDGAPADAGADTSVYFKPTATSSADYVITNLTDNTARFADGGGNTMTITSAGATGVVWTAGALFNLNSATVAAIVDANALPAVPAAADLGIDGLLDTTAPEVDSIATMDDNGDGTLDMVKVVFNEKVKDSTFASGNWTIGNMTVGSLAAPAADVTDDETIYIGVTSGSSTDTGYIPNVTATAGGIQDLSNNPLGILASGDITETDGAKPVVTAISTMDDDSDGKIDMIKATISESVDDSSFDSSKDGISVLTLGGTLVTPTSEVDTADDNVIYIGITEGAANTGAIGNYTADAGLINDRATPSNAMAAIVGGTVVETDDARPILLAVANFDTDSDGANDQIYLTFSENIADSSVQAGDILIDANRDGTYEITDADLVLGADILHEQTDAVNDQYLTLTSASLAGTGSAKVGVRVQANELADRASPANPSGAAQTIAYNAVSGNSDVAAPVALFANAATKSNPNTSANRYTKNITIKYSENISASTPDKTEFTVLNTADAGVTISSASVSTDTLTLVLDQADSDNNTDQMSVAYSGESIVDGAPNAAGTFLDTAVTDGVAPILLSSSCTDTGADGKINTCTLTYSEPLTTGDVTTVTAKGRGDEDVDVSSAAALGTGVTVTLNNADTDNWTGVIKISYTTGNGIVDGASNNAVSLTNEALTDNVAPALMSAAPSSASTITAVFSEPLLASSVERTDFDITTISGTIVRAVVSGSNVVITLPAEVNAWTLVGQTFSLAAAQTVTDAVPVTLTGLKTMTIGSASTSLVSIDVTPNTPSVRKGDTLQFTAVGTYSDNSTADITGSVTWTSSNTGAATINATSGLATGVSENQSTVIRATLGSVSGTETLTVNTVALSSIAITPTTATVGKGLTQQFTAVGTYSDNTTANITSQVIWTSSDTDVATIGVTGLATAVADSGTTNITASMSGKTSNTAVLTASDATVLSVTVAPALPTIAKGATQQFVAVATYTDGTTTTVTGTADWTSSNTAAATINAASGLATAVAEGSTVITAAFGGVSGTATLAVSSATLSSIAITPASPSNLPIGSTQQFVAIGTYSDGTTAVITSQVDWTSSNESKATIVDGTGVATGVAVGTANITAAMSGKTSNTVGITVTGASDTPTVTSPTTTVTVSSNSYTITGTSGADAAISVCSGQNNCTSGTADGDGDWSVAVSLNSGDNNFTVHAQESGKASSASVTVPTITQDGQGPTVEITSPTGSDTNDTTPLLTYTIEGGTVSAVKVDGVTVATRTGESLAELAPGSHTVRVEATDAASNAGSSSVTFRVDISVPGLLSANYPSGVYNEAITVLLTNGNGTIYYTTNGSTPTTSSSPYTVGGIGISGSTVLKAVCLGNNGGLGDVATFTYVIKTDLDGTPTQTIVLKNNQWNIFSVPKLVTSFTANTSPAQTTLTGLVSKLGTSGAAYLIEGSVWKNLVSDAIASSSSAHYHLEVPQPLYGYVIYNNSGADITMTITYDTSLATGENLFDRTLTAGWNSVGVADYQTALSADSTATISVDTSDGIGGMSPGVLGYVLDYTANANNSSVNFAGTARLRTSGSNETINIINPRETRGYLIFSQAGSFGGSQYLAEAE